MLFLKIFSCSNNENTSSTFKTIHKAELMFILTKCRVGERTVLSSMGGPTCAVPFWISLPLLSPLSFRFIWQKMLVASFDFDWLLWLLNATGVSSIICESSLKAEKVKKMFSNPWDLPGTVSSASLLSLSSCLAYLEQYLTTGEGGKLKEKTFQSWLFWRPSRCSSWDLW